MPANNFNIFQGQILNKEGPRQYTVMQLPEGYKMVGVQLPNTLKDQSAPLINSIVLVLQLQDYSAYIISVLREPFDFLNTDEQYAGFVPTDTNDYNASFKAQSNSILDGEIRIESTGPISPTGQLIPGFGAVLSLGNNGVAKLEAGSTSEHLIIGGTSSDDDHEVILTGHNGFIESNPNDITNIQSTYNWDDLNNIQIGNNLTVSGSSISTPINELTFDSFGNISLHNKLSSLELDTIGNMNLTGTTISLNVDPLLSLPSGVARIGDEVVSNITIDPIFWAWWATLSIKIAALPTTALDGGATLKAGLAALFATAPFSQTSAISTGSLTVFAGD